jgi:hypothetical protein
MGAKSQTGAPMAPQPTAEQHPGEVGIPQMAADPETKKIRSGPTRLGTVLEPEVARLGKKCRKGRGLARRPGGGKRRRNSVGIRARAQHRLTILALLEDWFVQHMPELMQMLCRPRFREALTGFQKSS